MFYNLVRVIFTRIDKVSKKIKQIIILSVLFFIIAFSCHDQIVLFIKLIKVSLYFLTREKFSQMNATELFNPQYDINTLLHSMFI